MINHNFKVYVKEEKKFYEVKGIFYGENEEIWWHDGNDWHLTTQIDIFTGRYDRLGKKIYTNDIIHWREETDNPDITYQGNGVVIYDPDFG